LGYKTRRNGTKKIVDIAKCIIWDGSIKLILRSKNLYLGFGEFDTFKRK
jgi:hypothetical protein